MPVLPDYSLLENKVFVVINNKSDSFLMSSGRIVGPEYLLGTKNEWSPFYKENILRFRPVNFRPVNEEDVRLKQYILRQWPSKNPYWLLFLIGLAFAIFLWIRYIRRQHKKEQDLQKQEQRRRNLFLQLGQKLATASDYSGIHDALQLDSDEKEIMSSTKISIFRYDAVRERLCCIAHSDSNPAEGEPARFAFEQLANYTYDLNNPKDRLRPAVWLWTNPEQEFLVVNQASVEFYGRMGVERPEPILGRAAQSFIFQLIRADGKPIGVIGIQREEANAYSGENAQKFREWLHIIKYFVELALSKIAKQETIEQK